jgi:3',5'-cyclic-AMP phosphodiesterase
VTVKPTLVAQISDLHIKSPGQLAYGKVDTAAALARCVAELNRFTPKLDVVVISGDLVDTPSAEEYVHLKELLEPLAIPFVAVPGNHDDRNLLRSSLRHQTYADADGALNIGLQVGPLDLFVLDSSVPGAAHGELSAATLNWLDAQLARGRERPALIFLHHPPFITGITHMDVQNLRNADALAAIVRAHPRVRLIASGHVHRAVLASFAGVPATICPAPNHAVALDLAQLYPPALRIEPPGFHVHAFLPDDGVGTLATHFVPIGDFGGLYPFFGPGQGVALGEGA